MFANVRFRQVETSKGLLGDIGGLKRLYRPKLDQTRCIRKHGGSCGRCRESCPQRIDPCIDRGKSARTECLRCGKCIDACPARALSPD